jgi:flagellar hook-associated protein 3 FlgL
MRISTNQIFQRATDGILDQQTQMSMSQLQLSSGKRVVTPSDDPTAAVQILQLQHSIDLANTYQTNIGFAESSLTSEEQAVSSVTDILQRVRELALQANTGLLDDPARQGIAQELQQNVKGLLDLANTQDGNGDYLFAGYSTNTKPFSESSTGFSYAGDQGQRFIQIGASRQVAITDSGSDVFQAIPNGNGTYVTSYNSTNTGTGVLDPGQVTNSAAWVPDTYTITFLTPTTYEVRNSSATLITSGAYQSGTAISFNGIQVSVSGAPATGDTFTIAPSTKQDVFSSVQNLANALSTNVTDATSQAKLSNDINQALVDIDRAMEKFTNVRAAVGARLNAIDAQKSINDNAISASQATLSSVQDLDYASAISTYNRQLVGLQAAQQTFVKMQNLSLFNYIT